MIVLPNASRIFGHSKVKWSKEQPDKDLDIYWTNKVSRGVQGSSKEYYAVSFKKNEAITIHEGYNMESGNKVWQVASHRPAFKSLEEAKEYTKSLLLDEGKPNE